MAYFYIILAILTAGISIVTGCINLYNGLLAEGRKAGLILGILSLLGFFYLLLPPIGFIIHDQPPYSAWLIVKRAFIWAYFALLPWFISSYSGYRKRVVIIAIDALFLASFILMAQAKPGSTDPDWLLFSMIPFVLVVGYGLIASLNQEKIAGHPGARWLLAAMACYGLLFMIGGLNRIGDNYFGNMLSTHEFFPFHLHLVIFFTCMTFGLRSGVRESDRSHANDQSKKIRWQKIHWNSVMHNLELLIIELDTSGSVQYMNPHATHTLGYGSEMELQGRDWFDTCLPKDEIVSGRSLFLECVRNKKALPNSVSNIRTKAGKQRVINWTNVLVYDNFSRIEGILGIGIDITDREKAYEQVQSLKNELEKENLILKGEQSSETFDPEIIGRSEVILYALQKARLVAATNAAVLLEGETGVGKELFASFIHKHSYRSAEPFIKVNCAALPAELIESELFGHEKGSFTGALQARKGRFELANGGTIFLDEIGELPLSLQPKLLRVLQSGEFERIGSQHTIKVDVRIISATNRNLLNEVKIHQFREDLYYRLNVFPITIPPLRSRKDDIPLLVTHFIHRISGDLNKRIEKISKADLIRLSEYPWYGNVRELVNVLERSIITSRDNIFKLDWLDKDNGPSFENFSEKGLQMEDMEREHIVRVLKSCDGKINGPDGAAAKLGLNPSTLRSRLKKLNIIRTGESSDQK
jgi:PAS domain S-box-containing protein